MKVLTRLGELETPCLFQTEHFGVHGTIDDEYGEIFEVTHFKTMLGVGKAMMWQAAVDLAKELETLDIDWSKVTEIGPQYEMFGSHFEAQRCMWIIQSARDRSKSRVLEAAWEASDGE